MACADFHAITSDRRTAQVKFTFLDSTIRKDRNNIYLSCNDKLYCFECDACAAMLQTGAAKRQFEPLLLKIEKMTAISGDQGECFAPFGKFNPQFGKLERWIWQTPPGIWQTGGEASRPLNRICQEADGPWTESGVILPGLRKEYGNPSSFF